MQKILLILCLSSVFNTFAQDPLLTKGSPFPDIIIRNISNAPVKEFDLNKTIDNKYYILNFWGTWCAPCIPEMDTLAKLQKNNSRTIKVIAISDDNEQRKANYLKNKPSDIWLATDSNYTLYNMLQLAYVGQSAIISPDKKIVALVRTDVINQPLIDSILRGDSITTTAGIKEPALPASDDLFGVDSLTTHSFSIRGYKTGQQSMSKSYLNSGPFAGRRLTWYNTSLGMIYRSAYHINSYKIQEIFDETVTEEEIYPKNYDDKSTLYCVDILVAATQTDSLYDLLRQYLNTSLPVKAKPGKKMMDVYVLKIKNNSSIKFEKSTATSSSFSFSGKGFTGTSITLKKFAEEYLTNELGLPVVDETGLTAYYDIITNVEQRNKAGILHSIESLGLFVEKAQREMPVIIYYR